MSAIDLHSPHHGCDFAALHDRVMMARLALVRPFRLYVEAVRGGSARMALGFSARFAPFGASPRAVLGTVPFVKFCGVRMAPLAPSIVLALAIALAALLCPTVDDARTASAELPSPPKSADPPGGCTGLYVPRC